MSRNFVISTEENLLKKEREILFEAWLIVNKTREINFPDWLKLQGFKLLFSLTPDYEGAKKEELK